MKKENEIIKELFGDNNTKIELQEEQKEKLFEASKIIYEKIINLNSVLKNSNRKGIWNLAFSSKEVEESIKNYYSNSIVDNDKEMDSKQIEVTKYILYKYKKDNMYYHHLLFRMKVMAGGLKYLINDTSNKKDDLQDIVLRISFLVLQMSVVLSLTYQFFAKRNMLEIYSEVMNLIEELDLFARVALVIVSTNLNENGGLEDGRKQEND